MGFSIWALTIHLIGGDSAFEANDTTLTAMLVAYLGGGAAAGCVVGLFRRLRHNLAGKVVIPFVAAFPVAVAMRFAVRGFAPWERMDFMAVAGLTVIWGTIGLVVFRND